MNTHLVVDPAALWISKHDLDFILLACRRGRQTLAAALLATFRRLGPSRSRAFLEVPPNSSQRACGPCASDERIEPRARLPPDLGPCRAVVREVVQRRLELVREERAGRMRSRLLLLLSFLVIVTAHRTTYKLRRRVLLRRDENAGVMDVGSLGLGACQWARERHVFCFGCR